MAYKLQVKLNYDEKTNDYRYYTIDISKSSMFDGTSYSRGTDTKKGQYRGDSLKYNLKDIDLFTTNFENETELKEHLVNFGLLPKNYSTRRLVIRFDSKKKAIKEYDILYSGATEYLEPSVIYNELYNRFLIGDFNFIGRVADKFRNSREFGEIACEIYNLANSSDTFSRNNGFNRRAYYGNDIITDFVYSMCYKYKINNGAKVFLNEINWRTLHQLAAVISSTINLEKQRQQKQQQGDMKIREKTLTKGDTNTPPQGEEQMSIMDWFWAMQDNK